MGDDDERAVVVGEGRLELLDRLEVEVVGRLVEDEELTPRRRELGELCARPLPGERVPDGRSTCSGRSLNWRAACARRPATGPCAP